MVDPPDGPSIGLKRYLALVEYDGTNYFGYQRQRDDFPTIQGEIELVLSQLAQRPVPITGAGRTDSGVHALGQVISFTIEWRHGLDALQRAMNANLPVDIAIKHLQEVEIDFHPRFDALRRAYCYYIYNAPTRSPLRRRRSWYVRQTLDLQSMNEAAAMLVGVHDFATFGLPPQGESTVREVFQACWKVENEYRVFRIEANAFLFRMVRSLVGSLVNVGLNKWSVADFADVFNAKDRDRSAAAAPPQGLYLAAITYK